VPIYQEQIMQIAQDIAGFTLAEADVLRKAMGKKIRHLLLEQKRKFMQGAIANNISEKTAEEIFSFIEPFAGYGFNRCLTGNAQIVDAKTGKIFLMREIVEKKLKNLQISTLDNSLRLAKAKILNVYKNGKKPIYQITTRLGKKIEATANHPFLKFSGWSLLSELKKGHRIALPRVLPINRRGPKIENFKLDLLGYLLAEGNFCHPHSFYFYSTNNDEINDYIKSLKKFKNTKATLNTDKRAISIYAGRVDLRMTSGAVEWIKSLGLSYKKATEKEFPDFVFQLNKNQLSRLLGKMFQGDGCINLKREYPQIFYATSSEKLAFQFQHLLLRLGIISSLYTKNFKYRGGVKIGYTLSINRFNNLKRFSLTLGKALVGQKRKTLAKIINTHPILNGTLNNAAARGSKDIIPCEILTLIKKEIKQKGYTIKNFAKKHKIAWRLFFADKQKNGYLRETIVKIGRALKSKNILQYANSDIIWDEIKEIKYKSVEETYDLTIEDTHNYIANDVFVHNSHAACYAMIAYQTAYLKAQYPAEFMAALLTSDQEDLDRIAIEIEECRDMGLEVLPPDVNESFNTFAVVKKGKKNVLRFALNGIKNLGNDIAKQIVEERKKNGKYKDFDDFINRLSSQKFNKKCLESLAKSGALDSLIERNQVLKNTERILTFAKNTLKAKEGGQSSLFAKFTAVLSPKLHLEKSLAASKKDRLAWEKELLGLYISSHPLIEYREFLEANATASNKLHALPGRQNFSVAGVINKIKKILTKKGDPMLFVDIEDLNGRVEILVFPRTLKENTAIWQEGRIILASGRLSEKDGEAKILCEKVKEINAESVTAWKNSPAFLAYKMRKEQELKNNASDASQTGKIEITLPPGASKTLLYQFKEIFDTNPGIYAIHLRIPDKNGNFKVVPTKARVGVSNELLGKIEQLVGEERVKVYEN